ncbi:MAG: bifunctional glycosyltransferase family 2/GtrA family protein [Clostridia bacterium]|nr:bifunctional glycosyltransferase family 2/GtrA family protein [Clostridia bacterium]
MKPQECCVLIPSLSPDEKLPAYVKELLAADFGLILVVDDGSASEYQPIFAEIAGWDRCAVTHHEVNRGKGAALRTGFAYIKEKTALRGVLTADSDGQHTVPDTLKLAAELGKKEELLLGSRDFSRNNPNVPPKSRFGNRMTSGVFRVLYGKWLPDTQTGLRAFDRDLIDFMLSVTGDRFEYEMNMLIQCSAKKIPMRPIPIETIYHEENKGTHFHPIRDSWRIYKLLLGSFFRYSAASILSFLVDYAVLSLLMFWAFAGSEYSFINILGIQFSFRALVAAPIARLCSAPVNFLLNRNYVFRVGGDRGAVGRYIVLAVCALAVTTVVFAFLDQYVSTAFLHILLKIVIDVAMYVINYRIQKAWVFPQYRTDAPAKGGKK